MKNLRISKSSMLVNLELDFALLQNSLYLTCEYTCFVYKSSKGEITADIDLSNVLNVKFLGKEIGNTYTEFNIWKENMHKIGVNLDKVIEENCYNTAIQNKITNMLKDTYGKNKF